MISFCDFDENTLVGDIRQKFNDLEVCKNWVAEYRPKKRAGRGAFDTIMAILLNGASASFSYQSNYCKAAYNKKNNDSSTWAQNAIKWTSNDKKNKKLKELCESIQESESLKDVYKKLEVWTGWATIQAKDEVGNIIQVSRKEQLLPLLNNSYRSVGGGEMEEVTNMKEEIIDLIENGGCRQIIFTGAPGTGKTYIAKQIADGDDGLGAEIEKDLEGRSIKYKFVQFHPSYDYTDFVEGLRPVQIGKEEVVTFVKMDGIFKKFCRKVVELNREHAENELYFFIIDEINRANLSKVFGELMFGFEKDKRGDKNRIQTQYSNLPTYDIDNKKYLKSEDDVFKEGFYIPENVVIIGTMNDIDRSVDSMDFALRRRFEWREFEVNEDMLLTAFSSEKNGVAVYNKYIRENAKELAKRVMVLNEDCIKKAGATYGLNEQYYISQGQFTNIPEDKESLEEIIVYVWKYRIASLLKEYLRGEDGITDFIENACKSFTGMTQEEIKKI